MLKSPEARWVKDYAESARLGGISRARITQTLNLRNLAPAIQERLFLEGGEDGSHPLQLPPPNDVPNTVCLMTTLLCALLENAAEILTCRRALIPSVDGLEHHITQ